MVLDALPRMGLPDFAPADGAFYAYVDVGHLTADSLALSAEILDRAGVAVTPGLDFDPARGARTLRLSYAGATGEVAEGLRRLSAHLARASARTRARTDARARRGLSAHAPVFCVPVAPRAYKRRASEPGPGPEGDRP